MYKNYIFDLYGTLVDIKTDEDKESLWEKMSIFYSFYGANYDPDDLKSKYNKYTSKLIEVSGDSDEIEINLEDVFFQLFKKKGVRPKNKVVRETARTFRLISLEKLGLYPYSLKVLKALRDKGKKLYLLTNAQACFTRNELLALGLHDMFDEIYISSELGVRKPHKHAFKAIISDNKLDVKKTVMIGNDLLADISGAQKAGMDTIHVIREGTGTKVDGIKSTYSIKSGDLREVLELTLK